MEENNTAEYVSLFKRKKPTILAIVLLFIMASVVLTIIQPFKYSAETKLLVIQNFPVNQDPYTASKSNEYLSSVLATVVSTNSFYNEVVNAGFNINTSYFPKDVKKLMRVWKDTVKANTQYDTGMINITVYHKDAYQADQIIRAVNSVLQTKHTLYHGLGDGVTIKILNQPVVSEKPVKPNIPLNLIVGFTIGLFLALIYVYLFPEEEYNLSMLGHKQTKQLNTPREINALSNSQVITHDTYVQDNSGGYTEEVLSPSQAAHIQSLGSTKDDNNDYAASENKQPDISNNTTTDDELGYEDIIKGHMDNVARNN